VQNQLIKHIVIVGGGTAGWLTAAILASDRSVKSLLKISLVEDPNEPPIGVGEGTWPSMRSTLKNIGISETEFIKCCNVSFKQGTQFISWLHGKNEKYFHPFSYPVGYPNINIARYLKPDNFAQLVCEQEFLCRNNLSAKQITTPEYGYIANYGYHLDSVKFSQFLKEFCLKNFGISHYLGKVKNIINNKFDDIEYIETNDHKIKGDLFIDCTGLSSLLIGKHYNIPLQKQSHFLFNDRVLAVQVPFGEDDTISSTTISTAQSAGWIWDIHLPNRRGIGYVHSSAFISLEQAYRELTQYLAKTLKLEQIEKLSVRNLNLNPGYRTKCWYQNCIAIGLSGGFVEPLEASSLVLVELAAQFLSSNMPNNRLMASVISQKFNQYINHQWSLIIAFLKLHYVLNQRTNSPYWNEHKKKETIPESLREQLNLWKYQPPWHLDQKSSHDLFPPVSFQYILYGMNFQHQPINTQYFKQNELNQVKHLLLQVKDKTHQMAQALPTNRQLIDKIKQYGLSMI